MDQIVIGNVCYILTDIGCLHIIFKSKTQSP